MIQYSEVSVACRFSYALPMAYMVIIDIMMPLFCGAQLLVSLALVLSPPRLYEKLLNHTNQVSRSHPRTR